jgi:histone H3/H4
VTLSSSLFFDLLYIKHTTKENMAVAASQNKLLKFKKNKKSTILSRNMGSLRRSVHMYGVGTVGMKRKMKPVHGVIPTLSISKTALYSFADFVGKFQVAVTKNAHGRPSKKANAKLTPGDIQDGFRSLSRDFYHKISNNMTPKLLMGKSVYPLPPKRTADIMRGVVSKRRISKKAIELLNKYTFNVVLHLIGVAGSKAESSGHCRISLDDFKSVYGTEMYGLEKIQLDEMARKKKRSPSSYKLLKSANPAAIVEDAPSDMIIDDDSDSGSSLTSEVPSDENDALSAGTSSDDEQ